MQWPFTVFHFCYLRHNLEALRRFTFGFGNISSTPNSTRYAAGRQFTILFQAAKPAANPSAACSSASRSDISRHKSRRESESGALSVASAASDELLSSAKQRISSVHEIQINRNITAVSQSFQASGRNRYCGAWTVARRSDEGIVELP